MKGHEKHILSPQSINFAPSVNLGRRTSHSPASSLFNDIWAIASCNGGVFLLMPNQKECKKIRRLLQSAKITSVKNTRYIIKL